MAPEFYIEKDYHYWGYFVFRKGGDDPIFTHRGERYTLSTSTFTYWGARFHVWRKRRMRPIRPSVVVWEG